MSRQRKIAAVTSALGAMALNRTVVNYSGPYSALPVGPQPTAAVKPLAWAPQVSISAPYYRPETLIAAATLLPSATYAQPEVAKEQVAPAPLEPKQASAPTAPTLLRAGLTVGISPPLIALLSTPLMIANQARQAGGKPTYSPGILLGLFLSNCRVSLLRGATNSGGKALTADKALAEEGLAAKAERELEEGVVEQSRLLSGTSISLMVAVLDTFIAGLSNRYKMAALQGQALAPVSGVTEKLARMKEVLRTSTVGASIRAPVSVVQAMTFFVAQPKVEKALREAGASEGVASTAGVMMTSALLSVLKNPTDVIQKNLLKLASENPNFARSFSEACQRALKLHGGARLFTVGLGTTFLQMAVVFGGLTVAGKLAESIVDHVMDEGPADRSGPSM